AGAVVGAPGRPARGGAAAPLLRLVPQARTTAARMPFVAVVVALLGTGLLGLLALNTVLAEGAFRLHSLEAEARDLATREQVLQRQVELLRAPGSLAQRAKDLGMVPGGPPVSLRLSDGAVLGTPVAGVAPPPPAPPAPVATAAAQPAARASGAPATGSTTWTAPRKASPAPRASGAAR
ncbi:MAG: hypothetical protein Q8R60_09230, partial [Mycobacteriales bacterium]|nr:hypothetical protein [Mycobacteriales bacterium]